MKKDTNIPLEHLEIFLKKEFIELIKVSAYRLFKEAGINNMAISEILRGKRNSSPKVGLRLAKYFGVSKSYFTGEMFFHCLDRDLSAGGNTSDQC